MRHGRRGPGKVVWLVHRRERIELRQRGEIFVVEHHGFAEMDAAVHDPMPDGRDRQPAEFPFEQFQHGSERGGVVGDLGAERLVGRAFSSHFRPQPRPGAEALDLPAHQPGEIEPGFEQREFERGRAGVEREDLPGHSAASATWGRAVRLAASDRRT